MEINVDSAKLQTSPTILLQLFFVLIVITFTLFCVQSSEPQFHVKAWLPFRNLKRLINRVTYVHMTKLSVITLVLLFQIVFRF